MLPYASTRDCTEAPRSFLESISVDFSENAPLDEDAFDPLRDGPLRFLGYSNEVGEAFAAWLPPGGVPASYALAISYVLVDTYDKGVKAYRRASRELNARSDLDASIDKEGYVGAVFDTRSSWGHDAHHQCTATTVVTFVLARLARLISTERAVDTVVWQLIASVAAPGYTIHTIVAITLAALTAAESLDAVQQTMQVGCWLLYTHHTEPLIHAVHAVLSAPCLCVGCTPPPQALATPLSMDAETLTALVNKSLPTAVGLATIPFIVHPIDNAVHALMNATLRPAMRKYVCDRGGNLAGLALCKEEECDAGSKH